MRVVAWPWERKVVVRKGEKTQRGEGDLTSLGFGRKL